MHLTGKVLVFSHPQDEMIPSPAQFAACMNGKDEEIIMNEDPNEPLFTRIINRIWSHGRDWYVDETTRYVNFVKQILKIRQRE